MGAAMTAVRERLPNRRHSESFTFQLGGLRFTCTVIRFADGRLGELFLTNHKSGNAIRKALCRDSRGRALVPVGAALDRITAHKP